MAGLIVIWMLASMQIDFLLSGRPKIKKEISSPACGSQISLP